jgi:hypothetical protein
MWSRRYLLKASAATSLVLGYGAHAGLQTGSGLFITDSRLPESLVLARKLDLKILDIASENENMWASLRHFSHAGDVSGLTRWSDWVLIRGMLEEKGKRVRQQTRIGGLFYWRMD